MIKGIGIDIIEIERIKESVEKYGDSFLQRIFTPAEIAYCRKGGKGLRYPELAARFAAKEAYVKALGTGMTKQGWTEIEVVKDPKGKPLLAVKGKRARKAHLTLSHSRDYAAAAVYVEK
jgi:holo-[acyl-carrier-protein] synthase